MSLFRKSLLLLSLGVAINASTFEQNGVKEGNDRVSIGVYTIIPDEGEESMTLYGTYGHFINDDIEVSLSSTVVMSNGDTLYWLKPGANYYFMKTPTLTPYAGASLYYFDSTIDSADSDYGSEIHVGAHQFLSEKMAITGEVGASFYQFDEYLQSYVNGYLTYFFD